MLQLTNIQGDTVLCLRVSALVSVKYYRILVQSFAISLNHMELPLV